MFRTNFNFYKNKTQALISNDLTGFLARGMFVKLGVSARIDKHDANSGMSQFH